MIQDITKNNMDYQISAPGDHRINFSERSIQTLNNHFVSILHVCDTEYPYNQWDIMIKQTVIILNMVQTSRINPKISAYNQLWGIFNVEKLHLHHQDARPSYINAYKKEEHGLITVLWDFI